MIDGVDFSGGEYRVEIQEGTREQCINIPVTDDSLAFEGDEEFVIKFDISQLPEGVEPGPTNISIVRIIDDDGAYVIITAYSHSSIIFPIVVRVFFEEESYPVTENGGPATLCVRREGDATESFSIDVATTETSPVQAQGI